MHPILTSHTCSLLRFKWAQLPKSIDCLALFPQLHNSMWTRTSSFASLATVMCDDGRPKISLGDRLSAIEGTFAQAYFGHAPTSAAIWSELERYCDALLAAAFDSETRSQALQKRLCGVLDNHPLNAFPVSPKQRCTVVKWTARLLERQRLEIGARVCFVYESLRCLTAWANLGRRAG